MQTQSHLAANGLQSGQGAPSESALVGVYEFTERLLTHKLWQGEDRSLLEAVVTDADEASEEDEVLAETSLNRRRRRL